MLSVIIKNVIMLSVAAPQIVFDVGMGTNSLR
jgi:hypothetical protein